MSDAYKRYFSQFILSQRNVTCTLKRSRNDVLRPNVKQTQTGRIITDTAHSGDVLPVSTFSVIALIFSILGA